MDENEIGKRLEENVAFFSNSGKLGREQCAVDQWLIATNRTNAIVERGGDPPDFLVAGCPVEVVEVMSPGRKKHEDFKDDLEKFKKGQCWGLHDFGKVAELDIVKEEGHKWILRGIERKIKKYESCKINVSQWTLLVYVTFSWSEKVNWPALSMEIKEFSVPFKSIEAIHNRALLGF